MKENPLAKLMANGQSQEPEQEKFAAGFVRSERNVQMRVKDKIQEQRQEIEEAKTALMQKLNKALVKLDKVNSQKRELGNQLLEQVKFVRDLQAATSNGDDIEGIVSAQMKIDFQRERELGQRLKGELKKCEQERLRLMEKLKLLTGEREIVIENSNGVTKTYQVTEVNIKDLLNELRLSKTTIAQNEELVRRATD